MSASLQLLPSIELIHRANAASIAYTLSRLQVLERLAGNPIGVAYRLFEGATALAAPGLPVSSFNTIVGLRRGQAHLIEPLALWSRDHGAKGRFEIAAGDDEPAIGRELARIGFFQSEFHATLIGEPDAIPEQAEETSVTQIETAADMEDFLDAYVAGWEIPNGAQDQFKVNVRPWRAEPGWSLYLARDDGRPAGAAILFIHDGVGYFADAAVAPAFRGRGLQRALLSRRWRDARAAGVDFVCSGAAFLSTSHRNMEGLGMRLLYLKAIWTPIE
jgi:ribosomal protein S18 acetylase RimI-like enzyme